MKYLLIFFLLFASLSTQAQHFLNGSFEATNLHHCLTDDPKDSINTYLLNVRAISDFRYGPMPGLYTWFYDLFNYNFCPSYPIIAINGQWYITLEISMLDSTNATAISLKLSDTLMNANKYSFSYYDKSVLFNAPPREIEFGLSENDSTFGVKIYESGLADTIWTKHIVTFIAPINGSYITARAKKGILETRGIVIDNFQYEDPNGIIASNIVKSSIAIIPNPNNGKFTLKNNMNITGIVSVYNIWGKKVYENKILGASSNSEFNFSELPAGIYFLQITNNNIEPEQIKFVIEK